MHKPILYFILLLTCFSLYSCVRTSTFYGAMGRGPGSAIVNDLNRNSPEKPPNAEPGKCYAKCEVINTSLAAGEKYLRYTGSEANVDGVVNREIVISEAGTKWIKKKADGNCRSANPDDCLVWCLVEVQREVIEISEVVDTVLVKEYEITNFPSIDEPTPYYEWKEVVCVNTITPKMVGDICLKLENLGYSQSCESRSLNKSIQASLNLYQKENNLAIGGLTYETLRALGL